MGVPLYLLLAPLFLLLELWQQHCLELIWPPYSDTLCGDVSAVLCPDPTCTIKGQVTQLQSLELAKVLKPCNCRCKNQIDLSWSYILSTLMQHLSNILQVFGIMNISLVLNFLIFIWQFDSSYIYIYTLATYEYMWNMQIRAPPHARAQYSITIQ